MKYLQFVAMSLFCTFTANLAISQESTEAELNRLEDLRYEPKNGDCLAQNLLSY